MTNIAEINAALSVRDPAAYRAQRQRAMGTTPEDRRVQARLRQAISAAVRRGDRAAERKARRAYDAYRIRAGAGAGAGARDGRRRSTGTGTGTDAHAHAVTTPTTREEVDMSATTHERVAAGREELKVNVLAAGSELLAGDMREGHVLRQALAHAEGLAQCLRWLVGYDEAHENPRHAAIQSDVRAGWPAKRDA